MNIYLQTKCGCTRMMGVDKFVPSIIVPLYDSLSLSLNPPMDHILVDVDGKLVLRETPQRVPIKVREFKYRRKIDGFPVYVEV